MSDEPIDATSTESGDDSPKTNHLVRRSFEGITMAHENAATQALIAKATADNQSRWIVAMRCPRDMDIVRQDIMLECKRPGFAKAAMYSVPRGGAKIEGLSIRAAEVAMRCLGNMNAEAMTLFDSDEDRMVRVTVTDYETNTSWSRDITIKKTVERKKLAQGQRPIRTRVNSFGDQIYIVEATDDDIVMKESSAISKASRTGILRMVPGHIQDEMKRVCKRTAETEAAKDPDAERNEMLDYFAGLSVRPDMLAEYLGHPMAQTTPAELVELRFLARGLRDGETNWGAIMDDVAKARAKNKETAAKHLADQKAKEPSAKPAPADATTTAAPPATATAPTGAKSGGKGTQAAKDKIAAKDKPAEAKPEPPKDHRAPTPAPKDPAPIDPAASVMMPPPGMEERLCAKCEASIDVPVGAPGARCYACRQGD